MTLGPKGLPRATLGSRDVGVDAAALRPVLDAAQRRAERLHVRHLAEHPLALGEGGKGVSWENERPSLLHGRAPR